MPPQDLLSEVLEFCEVGPDEDVTPREFATCWRAAADAAATMDRCAAGYTRACAGVGASGFAFVPKLVKLPGWLSARGCSIAERAQQLSAAPPRSNAPAQARSRWRDAQLWDHYL
jgi:hypothetical protein